MSISKAIIKISNEPSLNIKIGGLTLLDRIVFSLFHSGVIKAIYMDQQLITKKYHKKSIPCYDINEYNPHDPAIIIDEPIMINSQYVKDICENHQSSVVLSKKENSGQKRTLFYKIKNKQDIKIAKEKLRLSVYKEKDTLLATLFNRDMSTRVSLFLSNYVGFITPNMISIGSLALGLGAFVLLCSSTHYGLGVLAGIMYYLASLLDGMDGELARYKYKFSRFGLWLDNIVDEVLNFSIIVGTNLYSYHITGSSIFIQIALVAGILFLLGKGIQLFLIMFKLQPEDVSQFEVPSLKGESKTIRVINKIILGLSHIPRSDMMRFLLMIFALFNAITYYSYGISVFSLVFFIGVVISTLQTLVKRV